MPESKNLRILEPGSAEGSGDLRDLRIRDHHTFEPAGGADGGGNTTKMVCTLAPLSTRMRQSAQPLHNFRAASVRGERAPRMTAR
jgi:hypothetical protein